MSRCPTGEQHVLRHGDQTVVVVELGGGLREYSRAGRAVLDGFAAPDDVDGGRGQLLVPWPNRIRDGRYRWEGRELRLPITEPEAGNAIHGLLRGARWELRGRDAARILMGASLAPQPGYPFSLDVTAEYLLGDDGLTVTVDACNTGSATAPYGVGQHPYLTAGTALVDQAVLTVPARKWMRTDDRGLPVATEPVAGTSYDFRSPRAVGAQRLDTAYADLEPEASGRPTVRLAHPTGGHGVDVWLGQGTSYVQVFTGDTLPARARRRQGLAIEPMSCPPDAFRTGEDLVRLRPGQRHRMQWGIRPWPRWR